MNQLASASPSNKLLKLMATLALVLGAFWFIWTLLLWYKLHPHLPHGNKFVILDGLLTQPNFLADWRVLIEPNYAEHLMAIPRLLVALDIRLLDGQSHALYASAWVGLLSCLGILFYTARDYFEDNTSSRLFYIGIAVTLMFAPAHLWNLVNAINASWHITFACAFISFYVLVRRLEPPGIGAWIIAYLFAAIAAFTTFAGMIVWLLLPVLAVRCSRITLGITLLISVVLATVYSIGLSSSADIAVAWTGDNTLTVIVGRILRVLTWPLSSDKAITGALLVSLSLCVLAFSGIRFLQSEFRGQDGYHPWVKLCLMAAVLALGIAVTIQFDRPIEQPNQAVGPSFERYNTVGAIYWIGIMGLALSTLNYLGNLHRLLLMGSCLTITAVLIYPKGDYLQQEVKSMEHASRLYASGENPELRRQAGLKMSRIEPEYVFHFEPFFQEKELAYLAPGEPPYAPKDSSVDCPTNSMTARYKKSDIEGYTTIEVSLAAVQSMITRDVLIYSERKFLARLHQSHKDNYNPVELARPSSNVFTGKIPSQEANMGLLTLVANSLGPNLFHCRMPNIIVGS